MLCYSTYNFFCAWSHVFSEHWVGRELDRCVPLYVQISIDGGEHSTIKGLCRSQSVAGGTLGTLNRLLICHIVSIWGFITVQCRYRYMYTVLSALCCL